jgi:hypothetical protein
MGHHQATLIICGDHYTLDFVFVLSGTSLLLFLLLLCCCCVVVDVVAVAVAVLVVVLLLLIICFVGYFHPISSSGRFSVLL